MWYKSYVSMVMDPLSGHQAIGTATRPWTGPLMVDPLSVTKPEARPPIVDQTTRLDSTGLEHQHWIAAACGIIETLTLDPMTGIFCPFVSCLLHTKIGQHSLSPLYMISGTPPRFTQLS